MLDEVLEQMLNMAPSPSSIIQDGDRVFVNSQFLRLMGTRDKEDVIGPLEDTIVAEDVKPTKAKLQVIKDSSDATNYDYRLQHPSGEELTVRAAGINVQYRGKDAVLEQIADVSDYEETLIKHLAFVSHELKTPLTAALGYTNLLKRELIKVRL